MLRLFWAATGRGLTENAQATHLPSLFGSERIVYPYKGRGTGVFNKLSPDGPSSDRS